MATLAPDVKQWLQGISFYKVPGKDALEASLTEEQFHAEPSGAAINIMFAVGGYRYEAKGNNPVLDFEGDQPQIEHTGGASIFFTGEKALSILAENGVQFSGSSNYLGRLPG